MGFSLLYELALALPYYLYWNNQFYFSTSRPTLEPCTQPTYGKGNCFVRRCRFRQRVQHHEIMNGALEPNRCDADPSLAQLVGVGFTLVAHDIRLGGNDKRWRKSFELLYAGP